MKTTLLFSRITRSLAGAAAATALLTTAVAQTPLEVYDAAIAADSLSATEPLYPVAMLTEPVVLTGTGGSPFYFGYNSGSATIEFILKGNAAAGVSSYLAVGETPVSRLVFESYPDTEQLGFTQGGVADYLFTPAVPSPAEDTHIAYVWNVDTLTMKIFVNGKLAGTKTGVSAAFAMPSGQGWLGGSGATSVEAMTGTIYRVTAYDGIVSDGAIRRHSSAFGAHVRPALAAYDAVITNDTTAIPTARMNSTVILNGGMGTAFDFGNNPANATLEFILEGDPAANNSSWLAVGENQLSSLRFELWNDTGQMGFTQTAVADYAFTPGASSPSLPTHVTYAWDATSHTMKIYVNGVWVGTKTSVDANFAMPHGAGTLGSRYDGAEPMYGAVYRVTAYNTLLNDETILTHAKSFADLLAPPIIDSFTATPAVAAPNQPVTLSWQVQNATRVTVNGVDYTGLEQVSVSAANSTLYRLEAENALGSVYAELTLRVQPDLTAYDAAITADGANGLEPIAKLTSLVAADGTGTPFNFGANTGSGTMEFILEGDPNPRAGTAIASDLSGAPPVFRHSLRYSQWAAVWQLGFTKRAVADYKFSPLVTSPNWPTHVTYVWDAAATTMKVYINGTFAGETTAVDPGFALPTGDGLLGDQGMEGTIFRATVYDSILTDEKIREHGQAFLAAAQPALNAYDEAIEASAQGGLSASARLLAPIILTGDGGVNFWFGGSAGDATMEFILEGDPAAQAGSTLAYGENNPYSRLMYQLSLATGQLGFSVSGVEDYSFTPAVASPTTSTHVAYVWDSTTTTMKAYVNGALAGTKTDVYSGFTLPNEDGVLGNSGLFGEPMVGTIHRITVYDSIVPDAVLQDHGLAFAVQPPSIALTVSGTTATVVLSQGTPGLHYRVEYRDGLTAGDAWQVLQDIPALSGTAVSISDPTLINTRSYRYYRAVWVR